MQMDLQLLLILILFGFLAAFIDSVVGGGGLIALPALLFLGLNPTTAIATSKLASTIGLSTSTISFYRSGKIDFHSVKKNIFHWHFSALCLVLGPSHQSVQSY